MTLKLNGSTSGSVSLDAPASTTGGADFTITLPSSASIGDQVKIIDAEGTFAAENLTVGRNSHKIQGATSDLVISTSGAGIALVYNDSDNGWRLKYND